MEKHEGDGVVGGTSGEQTMIFACGRDHHVVPTTAVWPGSALTRRRRDIAFEVRENEKDEIN
jgi:hypothetical protein